MTRDEVLQFIPQRAPIVLVHDLSECSDQSGLTHFDVEDGHIFVENNELRTSGIIENMAQSVALFSGVAAKNRASDADGDFQPKVGFIAGVDKIQIHRLPKVGETLDTKVEIVNEVFAVKIVKAVVQINEEIIGEGELKIMEAPEDA